MRRKPAILLLLLLLLLSIGGAVAIHIVRQNRRPAFAEVDGFLRHVPETGTWAFAEHRVDTPCRLDRGGRWKNYLGLDHRIRFERDVYHFKDVKTDDSLRLTVWHRNGRVHEVTYAYSMTPLNEPTFHDRFCGRFPQLSEGYRFASIRIETPF